MTAPKVLHVRAKMPSATSTSFYLDRRDPTGYVRTLCGAEATDVDVEWKARAYKWTKANAYRACLDEVG